MSRGALKVLAILLMAGNHIAQVFLNRDTVPYHLLLTLGYATAPLMCAFLSDGFIYTHDRKAYGIRLLIFALVSELPFCLAFGRTGNMGREHSGIGARHCRTGSHAGQRAETGEGDLLDADPGECHPPTVSAPGYGPDAPGRRMGRGLNTC